MKIEVTHPMWQCDNGPRQLVIYLPSYLVVERGCRKYLVPQHSTPLASMTETGRDYIQKNVDLLSNG